MLMYAKIEGERILATSLNTVDETWERIEIPDDIILKIGGYRYVNGEFIFDPPEPEEPIIMPEELTPFDRLESQMVYTAMMTDTLLEEEE